MIDRFQRHVAAGDAFALGPEEDLSRHFTMQPRVVVKPRDPEQCAAVLAEAASLRAAVVPWGGGQHQDIGNVPRPVEVLLSLSAMTGIVEYDAADQTIVVRAGTRLADLVAMVREDGLMLPFDPPGLARATVGGVVATDVNGPLRAGYGRPRDVVLGTRSAHSDGAVARSGGRLVKNVTGFDLHRLYCGSLGTLGVLCEIALRLRPLPEMEATAVVFCDDTERVDAVLGWIRGAGESPVSYTVIDQATWRRIGAQPRADATESFVVAARFHGFENVVERSLSRVTAVATACVASRCELVRGAAETGLWAAIREARSKLDPKGRGVVLTYSLLAYDYQSGSIGSVLGGLIDAIYASLGEEIAPAAGIIAEPAAGCVSVYLPAPPDEPTLERLRALAGAGALGANAGSRARERRFTIAGGPAEWRVGRECRPVGGVPARYAARLKRGFDPTGILSPGRLGAGGES